MTRKEREQQEYVDALKSWGVEPGDTIYTVLRHVSPSGMTRVIGVYKIENNEPMWLSYATARALGWSFDGEREGVKVRGVGMDMGFHLVYTLSQKLFDDRYALKHRWL